MIVHHRTSARAVLAATIAALLLEGAAAPQAQRRRADNSSQGVPVATNAIAQDPQPYYDKLLSVSAGVDRVLSKTVFLVDQRRAVAGQMQAVGSPVLVVAPNLAGAVEPNGYLTIRGRLTRFERADLARVASRYTLDLAPDMEAAYRGRPVLIASSVVDARSAELSVKPAPTADETALTAAMKIIGPSFTALQAAAKESKAEGVAKGVSQLTPAFASTQALWTKLALPQADGWARDAATQVAAIEHAAAAGEWEGVATASATLGKLCQSCHGAYRERQDDGSFLVKVPPSQIKLLAN